MFCPFGCRETHEKKEAARRSKRYRGTTEGRNKKRKLNQRRYLNNGRDKVVDSGESAEEESLIRLILRYARMVSALIERRRVGLAEVVKLLMQKQRQRGLTKRRRADYIVMHLNTVPP